MPKIESEWLGGTQTAAYLGVTAMTIWRWQRDPKLTFPASTVIHGRKYWSRRDIDAWMRRMAAGKASAAKKHHAESDLQAAPNAESEIAVGARRYVDTRRLASITRISQNSFPLGCGGHRPAEDRQTLFDLGKLPEWLASRKTTQKGRDNGSRSA